MVNVHIPGLGEEGLLLVYVDTSAVHPGALHELKGAVEELVEFLDANVPGLIAYNVYFSDDGSQMTVVHVHPDSASLEQHLEIGGPAFRRFAGLLTLSSIRVYGEPSDKVRTQLRDKAQLLGCTDVSVHGQHAGFSRLPAS
jgi:hypothetical protein